MTGLEKRLRDLEAAEAQRPRPADGPGVEVVRRTILADRASEAAIEALRAAAAVDPRDPRAPALQAAANAAFNERVEALFGAQADHRPAKPRRQCWNLTPEMLETVRALTGRKT